MVDIFLNFLLWGSGLLSTKPLYSKWKYVMISLENCSRSPLPLLRIECTRVQNLKKLMELGETKGL